jgi:Na+/melibiose symporter-like transporter
MNLCQYKNILGEPNKGIHSYRFFGVSIMDVLMTIVGALLLSLFFRSKTVSFQTQFSITLGILFISGIILHHLFCVRTTVDKLLFPSKDT